MPKPTTPPSSTNKAPTAVTLSSNLVTENAAAGTDIGFVTVADPNKGDTFTFAVSDDRFEVVSGPKGKFILQLADGAEIDYEKTAQGGIQINVTATDSGGLSKTQAFTILVTDVNEAPESIALSSSTVTEHQAGAVVGTLSATDPEGSPVTFSITDDRFEITQNETGEFLLKLKDGESLDYETSTDHVYPINITASDGTLSSAQTFRLPILDDPADNNRAPESITLSSSTVAENAAGAVIGTLSANDPDGDPVTFSLTDERFEIAQDESGELNVLKLRDGESLDHIEAVPPALTFVPLTITATDSEGLSTTQDFSIVVKNVNEAPQGVVLSSSTVTENIAGAVIGELSATDPDGDTLTFSVSDDAFEVVRAESGASLLKLKEGQSLDYEAGESYPIDVTASDGTLSLTESFVLSIDNDISDDAIVGTEGPDTLSGTSGNDVIRGLGGQDLIFGNDGDDFIDGGAGRDALRGSAGNDTVQGAEDDDELMGGLGGDVLMGGAGTDVASYFNSVEGVTVDLLGVNANAGGEATGDTFDSIENLQGSLFSDSLFGDDAANILRGESAKDTLVGRGGNDRLSGGIDDDTLLGGAGDDVMEGHNGIDTVDYKEATGSVSVNLASGTATGNGSDTLITIENVSGSFFGDTITGDAQANLLSGNDGDDTLRGGSGDDHLFGDQGIDTAVYAGPRSNYTITENFPDNFSVTDNFGSDGSDRITDIERLQFLDGVFVPTDENEAPSDITLSSNTVAENVAGAVIGELSATDPDGDHITFSVADDRFEISTANQSDTSLLKLKEGKFLDYEASDNHTYALDITATDPAGLTGTQPFTIDITNVNEAPDTIALSSNTVSENDPGAVIGTLTAVDPDGDSLTFSIIDQRFEIAQNQNGEFLLKLRGDESLDYEASSAHTYLLDIETSDGAFSTAQTIELSITNDPTDNKIVGTENSDTLTGTSGNDSIQGLGGSDTIYGLEGDDVIHGGFGGDQLIGGSGADILDGSDDPLVQGQQDSSIYSESPEGVVVDLAGLTPNTGGDAAGDTLIDIEVVHGSYFSDVLFGDDSGNLLSGEVPFSSTDGSSDTLIGRGGNDTILGMWGDDYLDGGPGDDTLDGGAGIDTIAYRDATGGVQVSLLGQHAFGPGGIASVGFDVPLSIENVIGSMHGDYLIGDSNANALFGRNGDDTLRGEGGNDTLEGSDGIDIAFYAFGRASEYTITEADGGFKVVDNFGRDGTDILLGIEQVQFTDSAIDLVSTASSVDIL